jgi:hypothetical protein
MATLSEAFSAIAKAQEAEAIVILRQEEAARARGVSLQKLAAAFRKAASLSTDSVMRNRMEIYAQQSDREAEAAFLQQRVHASEARRARVQAKTTRGRSDALPAKRMRNGRRTA